MKTSASPIKSAVEEIDALGRLFRVTLKNYAASVETDLHRLREEVAAQEVAAKKPNGKKSSPELSPELVRDARDMLTLIRTLEIKPEKGRRRDLKKIEGVIEELRKIVGDW